jgi:hypothetical protein
MLVLVPAASTGPESRALGAAPATTLQLTGTGVGGALAIDVSANAVPVPPNTTDPCNVSDARDNGRSCLYTVPQGDNVTLTPVPATGFVGWSVFECEGTGQCVVNMDADRSVVGTWTPTSLEIVPTFGPAPAQEEKVTSSDGRISCSSTGVGDCSSSTFDAFALVTLTASPAAAFDSWSGVTPGDPGQHSACLEAGTSPTCTLFLSGNDVVGAKFKDATEDPQVIPPRQKIRLRVLIDAKSGGTVTSSRSRLSERISCGSVCSARFEQGENPTLTAQAAAGSHFVRWRGGSPYCTTNTQCRYPAFRTTQIKALFTAPPPPDKTLTLQKAGKGKGTVTSSPAGIACGSTCAHAFKHMTQVTLTAVPSSRSRFGGWSGSCAGTGPCTVTMSADRSVVATFKVLCVVPKVKGKTLRGAKRAIKKAHCSPGKVTRAFSKSVKKGRVISQKPRPGKKLAAGARVRLKVSKGTKP